MANRVSPKVNVFFFIIGELWRWFAIPFDTGCKGHGMIDLICNHLAWNKFGMEQSNSRTKNRGR